MMPGDDIQDLLGRYATGSLSEEERRRLFDAALTDQDLFDQLAREDELKKLLDEPGARDRMIRALEPPKRKTAWIFGVAAAAALSVVVAVVLLRPAPKPPQVAATPTTPPPAEIAKTETVPAPVEPTPPQPTPAPRSPKAKAAEEKPEPAEPSKEPVKKDADQVQVAAATPAPVQVQAIRSQVQGASQQQSSGPKQLATQARLVVPTSAAVADTKTPFGFHYSTEIQGHVSIIPAVDGYLFVKSNDGTVLYGPKLSAAGIIVDLPLQDAVSSVVITFSQNESPVETKPAVHSEPTGEIAGTGGLAVEIRIK